MSSRRVAHITFPKCGSQWVAGVLADCEIAECAGIERQAPVQFELRRKWAERGAGVFVGPIFNVTLNEWNNWSAPEDRAVVVVRDPRDQIVSWIFSLCYSHRAGASTDIFRDMLKSLDDRGKIALMCEHWRTFHGAFRSFVGRSEQPAENCLVTCYESLVENENRVFGEIFDFLGWRIPGPVRDRVVQRHSFTTRTGRRRGEECVKSHLRNGEAGDWTKYFDRETGRFFEYRYPGLLQELGYEDKSNWYKCLPPKPGRSFAAS